MRLIFSLRCAANVLSLKGVGGKVIETRKIGSLTGDALHNAKIFGDGKK